ncbi:hypothetical protein HanRHA438_Chr14g0675371 [Helianthus annuus]|uniref:Uncharacterized protein n=1 Tax=Helianthus annuus TaxID=4232 RepID=A0A9K3H9J0_HELAN|nr:hypothetical protein HanXRQr2_Chr14g0664151 [Helianthus annuus]KAJ0465726.1 hypothetical protein HanHA300_Chr14g0541311 [Helianthus annuus]KAJ0470619.1 hypothetical protein HanIR_Chr14g0720691 [Helianthus annuus]KAJ0487320.1 hypothetical protein HanHA89_Chr14g0589091 [Helianthus annuus]KAJ0661434.1 hypothetical protein HanOQP8_Chr14g0548471 [Helianthus annuus]
MMRLLRQADKGFQTLKVFLSNRVAEITATSGDYWGRLKLKLAGNKLLSRLTLGMGNNRKSTIPLRSVQSAVFGTGKGWWFSRTT